MEEGLAMNVLDIAFLVIIGISGLMSLRLGLIRECFALGAMLIALLAVAILGQTLASSLPNWLANVVVSQMIFMLISFLVIYLLIILLGSAIARQVRSVKMRVVDYLLVVCFGMLRGALTVILVTMGLTMVMPEGNETLARSKLHRLQHNPLSTLAKLFPEEANEAFSERHLRYRLISTAQPVIEQSFERSRYQPHSGQPEATDSLNGWTEPVIPPPAEGEVIDL